MTLRLLHILIAAASALSVRAADLCATNAAPCCGHEVSALPDESSAASTNVSATAGFNLAAGVVWKKFRKLKDKYVLGQPAEGQALAIFNMSLKSKNAELAAEARTILDAIAETRDILGDRLEAARSAGSPDAEEWIRLYLRSYPSRRRRFDARRAKNKQKEFR